MKTLSTAAIYDVVIIGGGPAGLSAALMLGRSCRRAVLIDAGEPRNARARELHGFIGRDGTNPRDLLHDARSELAKYSIDVLEENVITAEPIPRSSEQPFKTAFRVRTPGGHVLVGRKLLFATGVRDDIPDLPGFRECYGTSVHHCPYCDGWEHRGKHLAAFGYGADEAVGLGTALRSWSEHITVLTHGQPAAGEDKNRLARNGIALREAHVTHLVCREGQLQAVMLEDNSELAADALFFNTGQRAGCDLPAALGCETDNAHRGRTGERQTTKAPGVFLAGDADGDVQFVIVAAAEGATAAVTINRELQDEDRF
jgi:thioredoxin reductase